MDSRSQSRKQEDLDRRRNADDVQASQQAWKLMGQNR